MGSGDVYKRQGYENAASARQVGVFVGLWAPTFGILGVRAQLNEK